MLNFKEYTDAHPIINSDVYDTLYLAYKRLNKSQDRQHKCDHNFHLYEKLNSKYTVFICDKCGQRKIK